MRHCEAKSLPRRRFGDAPFWIAAALVAACVTAGAQEIQQCPSGGQYPIILSCLERVYAETPVWTGMTYDGNIIQVLSAEMREKWTILLIRPDGFAQVWAGGTFNEVIGQIGDPG